MARSSRARNGTAMFSARRYAGRRIDRDCPGSQQGEVGVAAKLRRAVEYACLAAHEQARTRRVRIEERMCVSGSGSSEPPSARNMATSLTPRPSLCGSANHSAHWRPGPDLRLDHRHQLALKGAMILPRPFTKGLGQVVWNVFDRKVHRHPWPLFTAIMEPLRSHCQSVNAIDCRYLTVFGWRVATGRMPSTLPPTPSGHRPPASITSILTGSSPGPGHCPRPSFLGSGGMSQCPLPTGRSLRWDAIDACVDGCSRGPARPDSRRRHAPSHTRQSTARPSSCESACPGSLTPAGVGNTLTGRSMTA